MLGQNKNPLTVTTRSETVVESTEEVKDPKTEITTNTEEEVAKTEPINNTEEETSKAEVMNDAAEVNPPQEPEPITKEEGGQEEEAKNE